MPRARPSRGALAERARETDSGEAFGVDMPRAHLDINCRKYIELHVSLTRCAGRIGRLCAANRSLLCLQHTRRRTSPESSPASHSFSSPINVRNRVPTTPHLLSFVRKSSADPLNPIARPNFPPSASERLDLRRRLQDRKYRRSEIQRERPPPFARRRRPCLTTNLARPTRLPSKPPRARPGRRSERCDRPPSQARPS